MFYFGSFTGIVYRLIYCLEWLYKTILNNIKILKVHKYFYPTGDHP